MSGPRGRRYTRELAPLHTDDGRTLTWCETGPAEAPVAALYLHGTGSSRLEVALYAEAAAATAVRLVAWDRPGHGGSSPQPGRTVADVVGDARLVAAAAGVDRPAVIGLSGGGSLVLALAALAPELVRHAVAINPGPPADEASLALIEHRMASMIRMARDQPRRFSVVAAVLQMRDPLSRALQRRQAHPLDRAVVFDSPLRGRFDAAAAEGERHRHAWVSEARMFWQQSWGVDLNSFAVPLDVFAGEDDQFRRFAESLAPAGATVHTFPGGHFSGFTADTMRAILRLVQA